MNIESISNTLSAWHDQVVDMAESMPEPFETTPGSIVVCMKDITLLSERLHEMSIILVQDYFEWQEPLLLESLTKQQTKEN